MDRPAITLALLIVLAITVDLILNSGSATLFLTRKFMELIKLVAFWR